MKKKKIGGAKRERSGVRSESDRGLIGESRNRGGYWGGDLEGGFTVSDYEEKGETSGEK
jgi:hypothetical protein